MKYMQIANSLIGTHEIKGHKDNPVIMEMYSTLGHSWVGHDEVPWCAAFVGFCLERGGIKSTKKLNARSYEKYGTLVYKKGAAGAGKLSSAREGDICVFSRANSSWKGHVAFFVSGTTSRIKCLGGNQQDAVNIKAYPLSKLVCIVRPIIEEPLTTPMASRLPEAPQAAPKRTLIDLLMRIFVK